MKLIPLGVCGAYPKAYMGTSSYFVVTDKKLLFDVGSFAMAKLLSIENNLNALDGVFISHFHPDHIADLFLLAHKLDRSYQKLKIFVFDGQSIFYQALLLEDKFEVVLGRVGDKFSFGNTEVEVVSAFHSIKTVGFRISHLGRTLYYTGDTVLTEEIKKNAVGADVILADSMVADKNVEAQPHMSAEEARELAILSNARLLATHVLEREVDRVKQVIAPFEMAEEMKEYDI